MGAPVATVAPAPADALAADAAAPGAPASTPDAPASSAPDYTIAVSTAYAHGRLPPKRRRRSLPPPPLPAIWEADEAAEAVADEVGQRAQGYAQALERTLGPASSTALGFTAVAVLVSWTVAWPSAVAAGGPAVLLWGWVVVGAFTLLTGAALAELSAAFPSAGSVYAWAGRLAPASSARAYAYTAGLAIALGNMAGDTALAWAFASFAATLCERATGAAFSTGATVGVACAVVGAWGALNALSTRVVRLVALAGASLAVVSTVALAAGCFVGAGGDPAVPPTWVWSTTYDGVGAGAPGGGGLAYLYVLGLLQSSFAFSGFEASSHMAEETRAAARTTPNAIVATCAATAVLGLLQIVALASSAPRLLGGGGYAAWAAAVAGGDDAAADASVGAYLSAALAAVADGGPLDVFFAFGDSWGFALSSLLLANAFLAGAVSMTVTVRCVWVMARDAALPASAALARVHGATPLAATALVTALVMALLLLPLATAEALTSILSITVVGFQAGYALPIALRVHAGSAFVQAPTFSLGRASLPVHAIAATWLAFTTLVSLFPASLPVSVAGINGEGEDSMNWSVAVCGVYSALAAAWWYAAARHSFVGPRAASQAAATAAAAASTAAVVAAQAAWERQLQLDAKLAVTAEQATVWCAPEGGALSPRTTPPTPPPPTIA